MKANFLIFACRKRSRSSQGRKPFTVSALKAQSHWRRSSGGGIDDANVNDMQAVAHW
jgi:hypothetical protein